MEEQRQRQEEETRRVQHDTIPEAPGLKKVSTLNFIYIFLFHNLEGVSGGEGVLAQADMASLPYNPVSIGQSLYTLPLFVFQFTGRDWPRIRGSPCK